MAVFADTFFYLALLNPHDAGHARVREANQARRRLVVTTHWVLMEVADAFATPAYRPKFVALLRALDADPMSKLIPADEALFRRGVELYEGRPDKDWPLTDCITFVVMEEQQIRDALTADAHFEQAGFVALFRSA